MYTDALPGGCLQTLVFRCVNLYHRPVNAYIYSSSFLLPPPISGADGDATLYEDDGVSVAYQTGDDKSRRGYSSDAALLLYRMSLTSRNSAAGDVRSTQFTWTDSTRDLCQGSWCMMNRRAQLKNTAGIRMKKMIAGCCQQCGE